MNTLQWLILLIISVSLGSFILTILANAPINIWLARLIGAIVAALIGIFIAYFFQLRNQKKDV